MSCSSLKPMWLNSLFARFLPLRRLLLLALMGLLLYVGSFGLVRTSIKAVAITGSWDLHPYWYFGHFVRAGINPYIAYEKGFVVPKTLQYWDGSAVLST